MSIADLIYKTLPKSQFVRIRNSYYSVLKKLYSPLTEEQFRQILSERLNITRGKVVFIHSSISKLNLGFPAHDALKILLDAVGPEGTLLFPAWQYGGSSEEYLRSARYKPFDVLKTHTVMGLLPELARREKRACRSLHPLVSIVAIGSKAEELTSDHHKSIYPCGEMSPYYKMLKYDPVIIGLGEKTVSLSFVHCVENILKEKFPYSVLSTQPVRLKVIDQERNEIEVETLISSGDFQKRRNIPGYIKRHIPKNICRCFRYRGANYFTIDARKMFDRMKELAENGITIYD